MPVETDPWSARKWTSSMGVFWLRAGARGTNLTTPQEHLFQGNVFDYVFCEEGCIVTQDIPDLAHPQYMELLENDYQDIFGLKGALLYSEMESQSDSDTYAIFNLTSESLCQV